MGDHGSPKAAGALAKVIAGPGAQEAGRRDEGGLLRRLLGLKLAEGLLQDRRGGLPVRHFVPPLGCLCGASELQPVGHPRADVIYSP